MTLEQLSEQVHTAEQELNQTLAQLREAYQTGAVTHTHYYIGGIPRTPDRMRAEMERVARSGMVG
jgi:hypothetical protein